MDEREMDERELDRLADRLRRKGILAGIVGVLMTLCLIGGIGTVIWKLWRGGIEWSVPIVLFVVWAVLGLMVRPLKKGLKRDLEKLDS